jgi:hypothetical protein
LDVITTVTTSLFASVVEVNIGLSVPVLTLFTCHWYEGVVPPLVGVAVNVTEVPAQIEPEGEAAIDTLTGSDGLTVIVSVVVVAHWPAVGVNVYVVVAVLLSAGAHVPVIPLVEVVGSGESVAPEHISATGANAGVTFGLTVIVSVAVVAHRPAVGVNV